MTTTFSPIDNDQLSRVTGGGVLRSSGAALGFGAGVAVTEALALAPSWRAQVPGQPPGFEKRHEAVVGPKVAGYARGLAAGPWKQFATGVADGASAAPGWAFAHGL